MKQYKCIKIKWSGRDTQEYLNELAENGWRVVCSYSMGDWLILERERKK